MTRAIARHVMCGLALVLASSASAQGIYSCKDRYGHTITSDRPIPECADRAVRELGPSGILRREIAPPLTPEERRLKEIEDRNRRIAEEGAREKRRRDSALLSAYSSEEKLDEARRRSLADIDESMRNSQNRLVDLTREKGVLAQEAEFYRKAPMPPLFKRKVDDNLVAIADEEAAIKARQGEMDRINQRYDEELRRYRELMANRR